MSRRRACICSFDSECSGTGIVHCSPPCGGDLCVCRCGGEAECCAACAADSQGAPFLNDDVGLPR